MYDRMTVIIGDSRFPDFTKAFVIDRDSSWRRSRIYVGEFNVFTYIEPWKLVDIHSLQYWLLKNVFKARHSKWIVKYNKFMHTYMW